MNIGVLALYGGGNLGNEASAAAVIQNLKVLFPESKVTCFSLNPSKSKLIYNEESYPVIPIKNVDRSLKQKNVDQMGTLSSNNLSIINKIRRKLKKIIFIKNIVTTFRRFSIMRALVEIKFAYISYKRLKRLNVLILSGTGILDDSWGGPWFEPFIVYKWALLAKLAGIKFYIYSVGAASSKSKFTKYFIRRAIEYADYVSLRDNKSKEICESLGCNKTLLVYPDLAHSLRIGNQLNRQNIKLTNMHVGINAVPMYHKSWSVADKNKYESYLQSLCDFTVHLLKNEIKVSYYTTDPADQWMYTDIIKSLSTLNDKSLVSRLYLHESNTIEELYRYLNKLDIIVASRFHGIILSILSGRPVLSISSESKHYEYLKAINSLESMVLSDQITSDSLINKFNYVLNNKHKII